MSVNFYKQSAGMLGLDPHTYWTAALAPVPAIHLVPVWSLGSPLDDDDQKTSTVTAEGEALLKGGATRIVTVHIPVPPAPPEPVLEALELAAILSNATAVMEMRAHNVTAQGAPLATCVWGPLGVNRDCGSPAGVGITLHGCSVKTRPTAGDYAGFAAAWLGDLVLGSLGEWITGDGLSAELKKLLFEEILKALGLDGALDELPSSDMIHDFIQRWVDDGFDEAEKQWREDVRKAQEERTAEEAEEARDPAKRLQNLLKKLGGKEAGGGKGGGEGRG